MTGIKHLVTELQPNDYEATVTYEDKSKSKVTGFGKVVVTPNITLVNVMLSKLLVIIYSQFVHLVRWAFLSSLNRT